MADPLVDVRLAVHPRESTSREGAAHRDRPFCVALVGDFSGRESRGELRTDLSALRPLRIDRDDFDPVMARLAPRLRLRLEPEGPPLDLSFAELDDFHPDRLFDRLPLFRELRRLRERGGDPGDEALPSPTAASGGLLDAIVAEAQPVASAPDPGEGLAAYVRRLVAPHRVADPDPGREAALARLDTVTGERMRALLHHPDFRAMESLWRAVFEMVRRVDTDETLRLFLVDVSRAELRADLDRGGDPRAGSLRRLFSATIADAPGEGEWSLLVAGFSFGTGPEDLALLGAMAELGMAVRAPWVAAAGTVLAGSASFTGIPDPASWSAPDPAWEAFRREPAARWLGLAFPRFLLRLPYGEDSDECERFRFEEAGDPPRHDDYLWGNPAFACALLLAQTFSDAGWEMRPGSVAEIDRLPLHLARIDGATAAQPCAEGWMTERAAERLIERGLMPLASLRDRDAVRLVRFQSVASPGAPLSGAWANSPRTPRDLA